MRAPRFPLQLSVRYRLVGAPGWLCGTTENISRSGVLIRSDDPIELHEPVELRVEMARLASGTEPAEIWCRGRVVRAVSQVNGQTCVGYAVALEEYSLLPPSPRFAPD